MWLSSLCKTAKGKGLFFGQVCLRATCCSIKVPRCSRGARAHLYLRRRLCHLYPLPRRFAEQSARILLVDHSLGVNMYCSYSSIYGNSRRKSVSNWVIAPDVVFIFEKGICPTFAHSDPINMDCQCCFHIYHVVLSHAPSTMFITGVALIRPIDTLACIAA